MNGLQHKIKGSIQLTESKARVMTGVEATAERKELHKALEETKTTAASTAKDLRRRGHNQ